MVRKELQEAETPLLLCGETAAPLTWQSLAVLWWTLSTQPTLAHTQSGPGNHAPATTSAILRLWAQFVMSQSKPV